MLDRRQREGSRLILEYLFPNLSLSDTSSDDPALTLSGEEEDAVADMVHFFLQARYEDAAAAAVRCRNSRHPEIRELALLCHVMISVAQHNTEAVQNDFQTLQLKSRYPENRRVVALNDVSRFVVSVFFHLGEDIAPSPQVDIRDSSEGIRLFSLYARSYALYLKQEYAQALGVAEAGLLMAADRHQIISIYLNLAASMAAMGLSRFELADQFFLNALELAIPDGYIQPFIGHHGPLQGMVEKHIRDREPELYRQIAEKVVRFRDGWAKIHNPQSPNQVTSLLTPYEFALAMLAAKGKTNQEIADFMYISINTVKSYLSVIYQKLGITKRTDLKDCLSK
ncbi:MAG: LuxR C-terminal-related transcriptional regulator [Bacillota bacterium]|nr:LuxR C-terminal-related transcriptional regulator [Bacillota bacterium]